MKKYILSVLVLLFVATQSIAAVPPPFILPPAGAATTLEGHAASYFQVAYAALSSIGGLTESAGGFPYFTADDTWAVLGIGTAYQILHVNSGATAPDWTSTLGATATRLTKGWFTDLEITNSPTVNGTALSALYQPLDSTLTGLAGIAITVDVNNVTFPGAVITTAADGQRKIAILANTVGVDPTADAFEMYPDSDDLWKINQHGTEYTFVLNGLASGGLIFGDSSPDTDGELGFASHQLSVHDGTASRDVLQVASTVITKSEYIPIRYGEADDSVQEPAATAEISTSTMVGRAFDKDTDEGLIFWWNVPLDYSAGIKYRVYYSPAVTASTTDLTAAFSLAGCSVGNSDAIACSEGTAVVVTDELTQTTDAAGDLMVTGWSDAVTVTNIASGEMAKLLFIRDVSEDDYTDGDLIVVGIEIKYQAKVNASGDY